jgi:hypothetical protein
MLNTKFCTGALMALLVLLVGCAGTVQREGGKAATPGSVLRLGYNRVDLQLTDDARKLQADNPQFSPKELARFMELRLDANNLLQVDAPYQIRITIDDFRVRSAASAVLLGILAGTDSLSGRVQIVDAAGQQLQAFKVNASYGLGGWGGGQDSMRMNWLYEKFAELTLNELTGNTKAVDLDKSAAKRTPQSNVVIAPKPTAPGTTAAPTTKAAGVAYLGSGFANIDDVDAIPYINDTARAQYREWLTKSTPRAFALSISGHYAWTNGIRPVDVSAPRDPSERALAICNRNSPEPCSLYAVNGVVVWKKDNTAAATPVTASTAP